MASGRLDTRVTIKRLSTTSDGYGGTTSTISDYKTIWARKTEASKYQVNGSGRIEMNNGRISRFIEIELLVRKRTADLIQNDDILNIEGDTATYRVNSIYESSKDFYKIVKATKID